MRPVGVAGDLNTLPGRLAGPRWRGLLLFGLMAGAGRHNISVWRSMARCLAGAIGAVQVLLGFKCHKSVLCIRLSHATLYNLSNLPTVSRNSRRGMTMSIIPCCNWNSAVWKPGGSFCLIVWLITLGP